MYKKKTFNRKHIILYVLLIAFIVLGAVAVTVSFNKKNQYVATVNGEFISVHEFERMIASGRAMIYKYFKEKYNIDDNAKFWTSSYSGESPIEMIRENAVKKLVRIKVQQILARQKVVIQDISYQGFLKDLEKENRRRAEVIKNNRVIYGPVKFNEKEYFDYTFSEMVFQVKDKIKKELSIDEKELIEYYETIKDKSFKKREKIRILKISAPYSSKYKTQKEDAEYKITEIKARLDKGEDFTKISELYSKDTSIKIECVGQVFDDSTVRSDGMRWPVLADMARNLPEGRISDIFEENESFYIIKCIEKSDSGYKPYDEVKDVVETYIVDDKYEKMIDKLVSEAKVDINKKVYERVKAR